MTIQKIKKYWLNKRLPTYSFKHLSLLAIVILISASYFSFAGLSTTSSKKPLVKTPPKSTAVSHNATSKSTSTTPASSKAIASTPVSTPPPPVKTITPAPSTVHVVKPSPSSSVSNLTPSSSSTSSGSTTSSSSSNASSVSYTSSNWSGYLAAGLSYSAVSASWTVPSATGIAGTTSADASWIGIGGVTTSDLIQIGTDNTVLSNGQLISTAFYELLPNSSQAVPGVIVSPGDNISASVREVSAGLWSISITDNTNHQSYTSSVAYASSNSSAEWIEEDPSYINGRLVPLDNFSNVGFSGATTTASGNSLNLYTASAQSITMLNTSNQVISLPSVISGQSSFSVSRLNP